MTLKTPSKWDKRFLDLAAHISTWSKDPSTKVGSVISSGNNIISLGFNGFPAGIEDNERLNNREDKLSIIIHAEINAILFAKRDLHNCTIYTYPFMPCHNCSNLIIQSGIKRVVSYISAEPRWLESFEMSKQKFQEAGIELDLYQNYEGN
jgi:dCMP deaminase